MKNWKWLFIPSAPLLFWVFFKIGIVFFGGGFVVIPVMHRELVSTLHLLSEQEFIDGTAISQLTPGPIAVLATFAGYRISGVIGALIATAAIFLPGSLLMFFLSKNYEIMRKITLMRKILDTLIPVIVGLLIAAAFLIGKAAIINWQELVIFLFALVALARFKVNPALLIIISAAVGFLLHF